MVPLEQDNPILHDPGYWEGRRFYSPEAGEKELQPYAARNGFVVTRRRTKTDRKGDPEKIVIKCGLGDSYRDRGNRVGWVAGNAKPVAEIARLSSVSEDMKPQILVMNDNCVPKPKILSTIQNPLLVSKDTENMRKRKEEGRASKALPQWKL
ncbi:hypothetical protein PsorP6_014536 [Peronosclerospora sorghi]|uniref:Uncharacterized protein n=1 Tax=Peronosclerospora sorghi TaxID=230839 RepID=A0ACC0VQZ3_9STRA|nr:hypothetical protein PsorP6_014536 [Peronosclerospora sorghi]